MAMYAALEKKVNEIVNRECGFEPCKLNIRIISYTLLDEDIYVKYSILWSENRITDSEVYIPESEFEDFKLED